MKSTRLARTGRPRAACEPLDRRLLLSADLFAGRIYSTPAGTRPGVVATADFNGDGKPDAVVGNGDGTLSVLLDSGGAYPSSTSYNAGGAVTSIAAVDVNGDGKIDIVVDNGGIGVLLNLGNGTFGPVTEYAFGLLASSSISAADFSGGTKPDIAVALNQGSTLNGRIALLLNNGNGTFASPVYSSANGTGTEGIAAGQFDSSTATNLAVANAGSDDVAILVYIGSGTFSASTTVRVTDGNGPFWLTVDDFNGDGLPDIAASCPTGGSVDILTGAGYGQFTDTASYSTELSIGQLVTGDINSDGKTDLTGIDQTGDVQVLYGGVGGAFTVGNSTPTASPSVGIGVADVNGDGRPDLIIPANAAAAVWVVLNQGGTTPFPTAATLQTSLPGTIAVADFNGDGIPDFSVTNNNYAGTVSVYLGLGNGLLQAPVTYAVGQHPAGIIAADVNGDGKPDLIVANNSTTGSVSVLINQGNGTFAPAVNYNVGSRPEQLAVADFNGDGRADLAVIDSTTSDVLILQGLGNGTFASPVTYPAGGIAPDAIAVADFNGDGSLDLAIANGTSDDVSILTNTGTGTFAAARLYAAGLGENSLTAADLNGDGNPDLLVVNYTQTGGISELINQTAARLAVETGSTLTINAAAAGGPVSLSAGSGLYTVTANGSSLSFNASAVSAITFTGTTGNDLLTINGVIAASVTFGTDGGTDAINVSSGGSVTFAGSPGFGTTINDAGAVTFAAGTSGINVVRLAGLNLSAGATAALATAASRSNRTLLMDGVLTVAAGATLDVGGNDVDLPGTTLAAVESLLKTGNNFGRWNGPGIDSSTAAGDTTHLTALGSLQNNQSGTPLFTSTKTFDGIVPGAADVLLKYTLYGDANLDGTVDGSDYTRVDAGFAAHGSLTGWFNGDFNDDGVIDGSDYSLIDNAFDGQTMKYPAAVVVAALVATGAAAATPAATLATSTTPDASGGHFVPAVFVPAQPAVGWSEPDAKAFFDGLDRLEEQPQPGGQGPTLPT